MTNERSKVCYIPECSIVRLSDGRIGWLGIGRKVVLLDGRSQLGVSVKPSTELEVIKRPVSFACEYMIALGQGGQ